MKNYLRPIAALLGAFAFAGTASAAVPELEAVRTWVIEMKSAPRGPFDQIRWFCKDGAILLPAPSACKPHGGGHQHGQWSERTLALRSAGYRVANLYADLEIDALLQEDPLQTPLAQMLVEQFLIQADDGWILRQARHYRGAFQEEGERAGARKLLLRLIAEPEWIGTRYLFLRIAAGLLPHGPETNSVREIRQLSAALFEQDPGFKRLRNKIHGRLEARDADAVTEYAGTQGKAALKPEFNRLAALIRAVYAADLVPTLEALAQRGASNPALVRALDASLQAWQAAATDRDKYLLGAILLAELRLRLAETPDPALRLAILDAGLVIEAEHFARAAQLRDALAGLTRGERLALVDASVQALFGVGLISQRQRDALLAERQTLSGVEVAVADYKRVLDYQALAPHWGTQNLRLFFGAAMDKLTEIEPKAALFIQDQVRGGPLFFYAELIDGLTRDANRLSGVRNELFGDDVGAGLRSLNPGLARGVLQVAAGDDSSKLDRNGIYLLPETVAELPPVAGILTEGEGNPLSHVQLLARNLGIPNVAVDQRLVEKLRAHAGEQVVLAGSTGGSVRLAVANEALNRLFATTAENQGGLLIKVDLDKLDLNERRFIGLKELRASDSGRTVGPKAAKLGELKFHYPLAVADGIAIPFGMFRALLDQTMAGESMSAFAWMQREYHALAAMPENSAERRAASDAFRGRLQQWIRTADPGTEFRDQLSARMTEVFGPDGSFGVFVRSDTNVEDLPGFTGAGLNLTLPNVVGFDNVFKAIAEVWASPFSERSFAWRQSLMDQPEHVYPAVLLLRSVDNDKSGVLVTRDIDTGSPDWLSVAVNEGVGGAVDGQSAESLRIAVATGKVRLLAQATTPIRRQIAPTGGIVKLPVSGRDAVLMPAEVANLIALARELPAKFPPIVDASGKATPADIEFGFLNGELRLFQLRPFLENDRARGAVYLQTMDSATSGAAATRVSLDTVPD